MSLERASLFQFLSLGFENPDAAWDVRFAPVRQEAARRGCSLPPASSADLAEDYFRLFGPAPACPQDLTLHLVENPFEQARQMADMAGFYRAFGVDPEPGERPDHLAVALSFVSFLFVKGKHAADQNRGEQRDVTAKALEDFVVQRLAPGVAAFAGKLAQVSPPPFYAALTDHLCREVFKIHAPAVRPVSRWEPRPENAEEGEMTCGLLNQPLPR